jgi:hypothetical protein
VEQKAAVAEGARGKARGGGLKDVVVEGNKKECAHAKDAETKAYADRNRARQQKTSEPLMGRVHSYLNPFRLSLFAVRCIPVLAQGCARGGRCEGTRRQKFEC